MKFNRDCPCLENVNRHVGLGRTLIMAFVLLSCLFAGEAVQAQSNSQQRYIQGLYRDYYQRNVGVTEMNEWLDWFRRGSSAEDIHASFIASDEFFNRLNRNSDRWLTNVFQIVVGRAPNVQEFDYWKQRFLALRQDRRAFGLEFLRSVGNRRPNTGMGTSSNTLDDLARQLNVQVRSLRNAVNQEYSGTSTVLRLQVNSLATAAAQLRSIAARSNASREQLNQAYFDMQAAYIGVKAGLRRQSGGFNSQLYLNQIGQNLERIRKLISVGNSGQPLDPPGFYPGWPNRPDANPNRPGEGWTSEQLRSLGQLTRKLDNEVTSLYYLLRSLSRIDYRYQALTNDMQTYSQDVNRLRDHVRNNSGRRRVSRSLRRLQNQAQEFNQRVVGQRVDVRIRQGLFEVEQTLAQLERVVGRWNPSNPGFPDNFPNYRQLIGEIDQAVAHCDRLISIYSSYVLFGRPVQVYLADLRGVRQQLLALRAAVVANQNPAQIRRDIDTVLTAISSLNRPWLNVTRSVLSVDNGDMEGLNQAANRIQAFAR